MPHRNDRRVPAAAVATAVAVALAATALAGCGGPDVPNLHSTGTAIVCLGDSITAGVGRGGSPGYPERLAELLGEPVVALGVPGDTTAGGRARLDQALAADPWLVIVELGGNDLLRGAPPAAVEPELRTIVEGVLAAGAVPMLVAVSAPLVEHGRAYGAMYRRLGEDYGVPVVADALPDILTDPRLKSDTIHPHGAGYERPAAEVADAVEPLLAARRRRAG
jgi:acyl-CoA thioesterase-1